MSILADKTERKAIEILARCVLLFEGLHYLHMSNEDSFDAKSAENLLRGIIESSGYSIVYRGGKQVIRKS